MFVFEATEEAAMVEAPLNELSFGLAPPKPLLATLGRVGVVLALALVISFDGCFARANEDCGVGLENVVVPPGKIDCSCLEKLLEVVSCSARERVDLKKVAAFVALVGDLILLLNVLEATESADNGDITSPGSFLVDGVAL